MLGAEGNYVFLRGRNARLLMNCLNKCVIFEGNVTPTADDTDNGYDNEKSTTSFTMKGQNQQKSKMRRSATMPLTSTSHQPGKS